ncbi:putative entry exclusion protein TrbK-alt [Xanthobacter autotrophicus]|uniref:putative entry exclusion protein TrbK-alt n=1 Tax=Xanthobacter autotrophicus TaxID=280 RepID=UPI001E63E96F|nr:putative entry exclusion protein TrbK-alt [Xanthobacter autotrophicus]UDQ88425.1 putative entry exclusion protein TrbK-alt [Xanthobacter autotrophicus]
MDQGTALRTLIVAGLVGAVIAALAIASGRPHEPTVTISSVKAGNVSSADLKSCATLEMANPIDPRCAALWEANRRRFFGEPVEGATP